MRLYHQLNCACVFLYTGSTATLTEVRVPGCSVLPCIVYRGTNVTVQYDFTASKSNLSRILDGKIKLRLIRFLAAAPSTNLTLDVTGKIGGVVLPWYYAIDFDII